MFKMCNPKMNEYRESIGLQIQGRQQFLLSIQSQLNSKRAVLLKEQNTFDALLHPKCSIFYLKDYLYSKIIFRYFFYVPVGS